MEHQRPDKREVSQIRALHCVFGQLNRVDGSSQFTAGSTSVLCGVYGPVDVKLYDEKIDRAHVEVKFRPDKGVPMTKEKWIESAVLSTFESAILTQLHPRTLIQINIQVRDNDGSIEAATINATMLALIDAGIPLKFTVSAASCAVLSDGTVLIDPTLEECESAESIHTFAFNNDGSADPIYVNSWGQFTKEELKKCHDLCKLASEKVYAFIRTAFQSKAIKESYTSST